MKPVNKTSPEEVILTIQDHWILLLKPFLIFTGGWTLALMLFSVSNTEATNFSENFFPLMLIAYFILIITHHFTFIFIFEYIISSIVITKKQIITVHFLPFLEDDIVFLEIQSIHEIEKKKHGILKHVLNYGDVNIYISGKDITEFTHIRHPGKFINLIDALKFNKSIENLDFQSMGASFSKRYSFLKNK